MSATQQKIDFLRSMGASEDMIKPLLDELKKDKPTSKEEPKPVVKKTVMIKKAKVKAKPVENVKAKPVEKEPVKIKQNKTQFVKGKKADFLKQQGITDEELQKRVVVKVKEEEPEENKPVVKRGRPKKVDLTKMTLSEKMKAIEDYGRDQEVREQRRAEAYQRKLEQRKEKRKAMGKQKGRPRKEQEEKPEKPKEKPQPKAFVGLTPKQIKQTFQMYKNRVIGYSDKDLKMTDKTIINAVEELQQLAVASNSNITLQEIDAIYKRLKQKYPDIFAKRYFLDALLFAVYLDKTITGERMTTTKDPKKARKDDREPKPEVVVYLQQDYPENDYGYWVKYAYNRIKSGKWNT